MARYTGSTGPLGASAFRIGEAPELDTDGADAERRIGRPTISIMIPTRNRPGELREAVAAVLAQDYDAWELVIQESGDQQTTGLPDDHRIVHLFQPDRCISHALNLAMAQTTGDVLHYACDDDRLLPGALTTVASSIGPAMWLRGRVEFVDPSGQLMFVAGDRPWDLRSLKRGRAKGWIPQPGVFWRREAGRAIGEFDESMPITADWDYWIRLGERWEPRSIDAVLAQYVVHETSVSRTMTDDQRAQGIRLERKYRVGRLGALDVRLDRSLERLNARWMRAKAQVHRRRRGSSGAEQTDL